MKKLRRNSLSIGQTWLLVGFSILIFISPLHSALASPPAQKTCQFLLAPTRKQYFSYLVSRISEFNSEKRELDLEKAEAKFQIFAQDIQLTVLLAPLKYFLDFDYGIYVKQDRASNEVFRGMLPFRKAIRQVIYQHRADRKERAQVLTEIFKKNYSSPFLDEILGLNQTDLEIAEDTEMRNAKLEIGQFNLSHAHDIGLAATHDYWFSKHRQLVHELELITDLKATRIADLGSGTGRLGLIAGFLFPNINFIGLEIYEPRVAAAQAAAERFGFSNRIQFRVQDLLDKTKAFPVADYYYIYGPTNSTTINEAVVDRLGPIAKIKSFSVSSIHSNTIAHLRARSWLKEFPSQRPVPSTQFRSR